MRIALIGEYRSENLGEPLLFCCSEFVLKELDRTVKIDKFDFYARENKGDNCRGKCGIPLIHFGIRVLCKISRIVGISSIKLDKWEWQLSGEEKRLTEYFTNAFLDGNYDGIIIMGAGTLKYDVRLNFAPYYKVVVDSAKKSNIPVYINCVGVESKYNALDERCIAFSQYLSDSIIKIITTRDDIETLKKYVKNSDIQVGKISDIGVWSAETFGIQKKQSECIGLGMITPERFKEFGRRETYVKYKKLWIEIIKKLDKANIEWKIFNNGDRCDRQFAEELCSELGKNISESVLTPEKPEELVQIISGFKGIITSRLHSCIVAYSLEIPFVAISWNNKLKFFANEIKVPERIIEADELEAEIILNKFNRACEEGYDDVWHKSFRDTSKEAMKVYIQSMKEKRN